MAEFRWLHFSDLHWGKTDHDIHWSRLEKALFDDFGELCDLTGQAGWDAVFFTGDIANTGSPEQFVAAGEKINRILDELGEHGSRPQAFYVPGNHDLQRIINPRSKTKKQLRDNLQSMVKFWFEENNGQFTDFFDRPDQCLYMDGVQSVFSPYTNFWQAQPDFPSVTPGIVPGDFSVTLGPEDLKIGVVGLNSAFLHLEGGDFEKRLDLDLRQIKSCLPSDKEITDWFWDHDAAILLTHHPQSWLNPQNRDKHNQIFDPGWFGLHLYGHAHVQEYRDIYLQGNTENVKQVQSSALFSREEYEIYANNKVVERFPRIHGYSSGVLYTEGDDILFRLWPRSIDTGREGSFFEKPSGVKPWRGKRDEGIAPVKVTSCRRNGHPGPLHPIGFLRPSTHAVTEAHAVLNLVCKGIEACLETSGLELFKTNLQRQVAYKWNRPAAPFQNLSEALKTLYMEKSEIDMNLIDKALSAVKLAREDTLKEGGDVSGAGEGYAERVWKLAENLLGWLMLLTVNPGWVAGKHAEIEQIPDAVPVEVLTAPGGGHCLCLVQQEAGIFY